MDFSTTGGGSNGKIDCAPRYSILGSYLKAGPGGQGRSSSATPPQDTGDNETTGIETSVANGAVAYDAATAAAAALRRSELAEDLRRAGYGGANSPWLNSLEQLTSLASTQHRPASRDSRGDSREERNSSGEDIEKDSKVSYFINLFFPHHESILILWI